LRQNKENEEIEEIEILEKEEDYEVLEEKVEEITEEILEENHIRKKLMTFLSHFAYYFVCNNAMFILFLNFFI
jgi:hypothetical protein